MIMKICSTHLKLEKCITLKIRNICDFDRNLKTERNLQHFSRNCRIKNLRDF